MKNLRTFLLCTCITACSVSSFAQTAAAPLNEPNANKPLLFANLPQQVNVDADVFSLLLNTTVGATINIPISVVFRFQGQVVSNVNKYGNTLHSVVVRSTNYNGASLTLAKYTAENGSITYTGRIISMAHGDLFELQYQNGQYSFVKKKFYELLNE
jgi:hypothetical protein